MFDCWIAQADGILLDSLKRLSLLMTKTPNTEIFYQLVFTPNIKKIFQKFIFQIPEPTKNILSVVSSRFSGQSVIQKRVFSNFSVKICFGINRNSKKKKKKFKL